MPNKIHKITQYHQRSRLSGWLRCRWTAVLGLRCFAVLFGSNCILRSLYHSKVDLSFPHARQATSTTAAATATGFRSACAQQRARIIHKHEGFKRWRAPHQLERNPRPELQVRHVSGRLCVAALHACNASNAPTRRHSRVQGLLAPTLDTIALLGVFFFGFVFL